MKNSSLPEPRKMKKVTAVTDEQIGKVLMACKGLQYIAAEKLDLSYQYISERINKSPYLLAVRADAIERRIDFAEEKLDELASEKSLGAICFFLKTRAKHRGYVESQDDKPAPDALDKLEKMMDFLDKRQSRNIETSNLSTAASSEAVTEE